MNYDELCVSILKQRGPLLGSELAKYIITKSNIKSNYARQIISRALKGGFINSTYPVKFQRQEMIYSINGQRINEKLKAVVYDKSKKMSRLLDAMIDNNGFLTYEEFCKISAGFIPEASDYHSKHKTVKKLVDEMIILGIIRRPIEIDDTKLIVADNKWTSIVRFDETLAKLRINSLELSKLYIKELLRWMERLNLAGWETTQITESNEYGKNGFWWDAYGFSYVWGLYKSKKEKNIFNPSTEKSGSLIVVEAILHRQMKIYDVAGFIDRIGMIYNRLKIKDNFRIIPVCFANSLENEAFELAKSKGIIIANVSEVFGSKIAEALLKIEKINIKDIKSEKIGEIIGLIENNEDGRFGNLKGYVFNFLIASVMNIQGYGIPKIGRKYRFDNKECEVDLVFELEDDLIICETKGYSRSNSIKLGNNSNENDSVKKFFEKTCYIVKKSTGKNIIPIFIASCSFDDDAIKYMQEKKQTKKMRNLLENSRAPRNIYYDYNKLMAMLSRKSVYSEHRKVIKEYFK